MQKVVIVPRAKKDKITIHGISLKLFYNIKNPTNGFMRMAAPLIKISVNGSLLTTSNMKLIEIPQDVRDPSGKIIIHPFKETGEIDFR